MRKGRVNYLTLPFSFLYLRWTQQIQRNDFDIGLENLLVLQEAKYLTGLQDRLDIYPPDLWRINPVNQKNISQSRRRGIIWSMKKQPRLLLDVLIVYIKRWGLEREELKLSVSSRPALPVPRPGGDREARCNKVSLGLAIPSKYPLFVTILL